jgi:hypothetical protein
MITKVKVSKKIFNLEEHKDVINQKIKNKNFLLQFLPTSLNHLKNRKVIHYKGKKLKSNYLIDVVHTMLLKYYFKKENRFTLNSEILKKRYGQNYNYYIKYLLEIGTISLVFNYHKGNNSRIYKLKPIIFSSKVERYKNEDKILLKKYKSKITDSLDYGDKDTSLIDAKVKNKLIADLFHVEVDDLRSIFYLDSLKSKNFTLYNRNVYSVESIKDNHIFYHFDIYGRMHTNFTILKSFIRKNCLLIDGEETCEIDIKNSQPLFLAKLIKDIETKWVKEDEYNLFYTLTSSGKYYDYILNNSSLESKKDAKQATYKVLFGRNYKNSKADKIFSNLFPSIHHFIKLYKKDKGNYKTLAYGLQKSESNLIFNKIVKDIIEKYPEIRLITVHDSIIIPKRYRKQVSDIFNEKLKEEFNSKVFTL